ncbi:intein-containing atp-dependent DNA helicase hfm1-related precursor [Anaeramoeba flamelloides]|uniref:DNA 3'-5' helicase n=1 Tax=Anaeramoeba flamelloides TaxID=1746091 RepID=A0ABQ8YW70_9EUKA|nr:intein-containing atp-dependent DNA helicase hfm1-related precursor [Anaeramoeba flamelloides]
MNKKDQTKKQKNNKPLINEEKKEMYEMNKDKSFGGIENKPKKFEKKKTTFISAKTFFLNTNNKKKINGNNYENYKLITKKQDLVKQPRKKRKLSNKKNVETREEEEEEGNKNVEAKKKEKKQVDTDNLLPISILPKEFQNLFSFQYFNKLQTDLFRLSYKTDDNLVFSSPTSSGKCLGKYTKVIMWGGSKPKRVKDLKGGDLLLGPDSRPRKIVSTVQGYDHLYKAKSNNKLLFVCNQHHILSLKIKNNPQRIINLSVNDYLKLNKGLQRKLKFWRPKFIQQFSFNQKEKQIERKLQKLKYYDLNEKDQKKEFKKLLLSNYKNRRLLYNLIKKWNNNKNYYQFNNKTITADFCFLITSIGKQYKKINSRSILIQNQKRKGNYYLIDFEIEYYKYGKYYGFELKTMDHVDLPQGQNISPQISKNFPCNTCENSSSKENLFLLDNFIVSHNTVILELSILRIFKKNLHPKIIYLAPLKALVQEKIKEWKKFKQIGLKIKEISGDTRYGLEILEKVNILVCTPEKFDLISRNKLKYKKYLKFINLILIDEVHLLTIENRGPTLEVIISRMKKIMKDYQTNIRFIACSATIPNLQSIGKWLKCKMECIRYYDESIRPVPLRVKVLGYKKKNDYLFDMNLNYEIPNIIRNIAINKGTLIFCSTRSSCYRCANYLSKDESLFFILQNERQELILQSTLIENPKLKKVIKKGIAFFHSGLSLNDRQIIEKLFKKMILTIIVSTSSLAQGVNLPVKLVIIKGTKLYSKNIQEYDPITMIQMIGRSGRVNYNSKGYVYILTEENQINKYQNIIYGKQQIESSLLNSMLVHLNAEIVLGTITKMKEVKKWLKSTYLFVRVFENPSYYNFDNLNNKLLKKKLFQICVQQLNKLTQNNLIRVNNYNKFCYTSFGHSMSRNYIQFKTMEFLLNLKLPLNMKKILKLLCFSSEFATIYIRADEKKILNGLLKKMRFSLKINKVKTKYEKIYVLLQSFLCNNKIDDYSLQNESINFSKIGQRIIRTLIDILVSKCDLVSLRSSICLITCFKQQMWEDSNLLLNQLKTLDRTTTMKLFQLGICNFQDLSKLSPYQIEFFSQKFSPFGTNILNELQSIPRINIEELIRIKPNKYKIKIVDYSQTINGNYLNILISKDNQLILYRKIKTLANQMPLYISFVGKYNYFLIEIISEEYFGVNIKKTYTF